jgi:hypothetical protein
MIEENKTKNNKNNMKKIFFLLLIIWVSNLYSQDDFANINLYEPDNLEELENFFGDSTLNKYKIYFTGKNHEYAKINSELEYKILTYLHKTQNVRNFLFEQSPAVGYIMTKVVVDNDLENKYYLKDRYYKPFYDLIMNIKEFNFSLDTIQKIRVHGIDVERFPAFSIFALNDITKDLDTEGETGIVYEGIRALVTSEFKDGTPAQIYNEGGIRLNLMGDEIDAWSTFETIIEASKELKEKIKLELGDDYGIFTQILDGVEKGHEWYHSERNGDLTAPLVRERFMLKQFKLVYSVRSEAKFYGQFGRCHLHGNKSAKRCYSHDMESIASRINNSMDSTLNGKVLSIPVYYSNSKNFDGKIIEALKLSERLKRENEIFLIDLNYLKEDNPIIGFGENLPFVIINNYLPKSIQDIYSFNYTLVEMHFGAFYGFQFFNKLNDLNTELNGAGSNGFTNKFLTNSFTFDFITMNDMGYHVGYSYLREVNNGDRFSLKGNSLTVGNSYPFGNKILMGAVGLNYTYGQMILREQNNGNDPNLIQSESGNVIVYKNDIFSLDPNIDFRLTFPIISFNARVGYAIDVSGKYWKLDGKMKDFSKTSFSSPYVQLGISLNFKDEY